jgi:tetratricopeptide (TPR) repeat protein
MSEQKDEPIVDIQQSFSRTEEYVQSNKKSISIILGGILVAVAGYFGYQKYYVEPLEAEAQQEIFWAERYFEQDSLNKAIAGDGEHLGLEEIVDKYGSTPSGNLAHYYLGISYLGTGKYEEAIDELGSFDAKDNYLGPISVSAIGDAHMELGKTDDAVSYYIKAANMNRNQFTTPTFLMKAAKAYEEKNDFKEALKVYEQIKSDFPDSRDGKEMDKYIAYAKAKAGIE